MSVAEQQLWGGETAKAVENFPVSGERVPVSVVRWLAAIKGAAARVNADLGKLDSVLAETFGAAADDIAAGKHDDQFPIDVFQTGSGTSTNMTANEVIANLAGEGAHPNDHVNLGQSSNDVFPSAVHLAALDEATNTLLPTPERSRQPARGSSLRLPSICSTVFPALVHHAGGRGRDRRCWKRVRSDAVL
jgi:fumarate hydratase class II